MENDGTRRGFTVQEMSQKNVASGMFDYMSMIKKKLQG